MQRVQQNLHTSSIACDRVNKRTSYLFRAVHFRSSPNNGFAMQMRSDQMVMQLSCTTYWVRIGNDYFSIHFSTDVQGTHPDFCYRARQLRKLRKFRMLIHPSSEINYISIRSYCSFAEHTFPAVYCLLYDMVHDAKFAVDSPHSPTPFTSHRLSSASIAAHRDCGSGASFGGGPNARAWGLKQNLHSPQKFASVLITFQSAALR